MWWLLRIMVLILMWLYLKAIFMVFSVILKKVIIGALSF
uniref:Uncharacterized protein n=1 Tax=Plesiomonas shigelloides TaxID=703 RepID=A0A4D6U7H9_PLESH|nr:hypothetical protein [Plesiomonas shigelloides]